MTRATREAEGTVTNPAETNKPEARNRPTAPTPGYADAASVRTHSSRPGACSESFAAVRADYLCKDSTLVATSRKSG